MYSIDDIKRLAKESRDDTFYFRAYESSLKLAGYSKDAAQIAGIQKYGTMGDPLGVYPDLDPAEMDRGVQNYLYQDFTTNVSVVVYGDPEFVISEDNPTISEYNEAYLRERWTGDEWTSTFYQVMMDLYASGTGWCEVGIGEDGGPSVEHLPITDVLWDPLCRRASKARYVFVRRRLTLDILKEKYPSLTDDQINQVKRTLSPKMTVTRTMTGQLIEAVNEWTFWAKDTYVTILGPIETGIVFKWDGNTHVETTEPGGNPYGLIPVVAAEEIGLPNMRRPAGRCLFAEPIAQHMQEIDGYITTIVERGIPLTLFDTSGLEPEEADKLRNAKGKDDVAMFLPVDSPEAMNAIHRIPPLEIPQTVLAARSMRKEELNNSTGVMDAQRGQAFQGERRTRFEVQAYMDAGGVKVRQTQKLFANFLKRLIKVVRAVGAKYDRRDIVLQLASGARVRTRDFPVQPFLSLEMNIEIMESSLQFVSKDQKSRDRLVMFQGRDVPLIQMGIANPMAVALDVFKQTGATDPKALMNSAPAPPMNGPDTQASTGQVPGQAPLPSENQ